MFLNRVGDEWNRLNDQTVSVDSGKLSHQANLGVGIGFSEERFVLERLRFSCNFPDFSHSVMCVRIDVTDQ